MPNVPRSNVTEPYSGGFSSRLMTKDLGLAVDSKDALWSLLMRLSVQGMF